MFSALNLKIGLHNGSLNMETAEFVVAQYKIIILCARTHGIKGVKCYLHSTDRARACSVMQENRRVRGSIWTRNNITVVSQTSKKQTTLKKCRVLLKRRRTVFKEKKNIVIILEPDYCSRFFPLYFFFFLVNSRTRVRNTKSAISETIVKLITTTTTTILYCAFMQIYRVASTSRTFPSKSVNFTVARPIRLIERQTRCSRRPRTAFIETIVFFFYALF